MKASARTQNKKLKNSKCLRTAERWIIKNAHDSDENTFKLSTFVISTDLLAN